jgi:hypothetical protein
MSEWIDISDSLAWDKRPNKYELLYPSGKTQKVIIFGNAESATLQFDLPPEEEPTHWRPIKK